MSNGGTMKFRKKPVIIEAVQLREDTLDELYDFLNIAGKGSFLECGHGIDPTDGKFKITTLEGVHVAIVGDWIIKGVHGEFYPCKPDIFDKTYEVVYEEGKSLTEQEANQIATDTLEFLVNNSK